MRKKCAKCNGKGYLYPDLSLNLPVAKCDLCDGTGIPMQRIQPTIYRDLEEEQLKYANEQSTLLLCYCIGLFSFIAIGVICLINQRHDLLLAIFGK